MIMIIIIIIIHEHWKYVPEYIKDNRMFSVKIQKNLHSMPFEIMNILNCRKQRTCHSRFTRTLSDCEIYLSVGWRAFHKHIILLEKLYVFWRDLTFLYLQLRPTAWFCPPTSIHFFAVVLHHHDTPHSVGTGSVGAAETSFSQHKHTKKKNIHAPGGIWTHNLSRREAADPRLRPRVHWNLRV
jgi:hypothetical protein